MIATTNAIDSIQVLQPKDNDGLKPCLDVSRELSARLDSIPNSARGSQHPSLGVARALARTLVDMLEQISASEVH